MRVPRSPWILRPEARPEADLRLLCLPYAGGGASAFRAWPAALPPPIEVWAVQYPGRENRLAEPLHRQFPALVEAVANGLGPLIAPPYAVFGHSMGALLAFELVRALRRRALALPVQIIVSGCRPPHLAHEDRIGRDLSDATLVDLLGRYQGIPRAALDMPGFLDLTLPVIRADFAVYDDYAFADDAPLSCPILAMGGRADPGVPVSVLDGWGQHTTGRFELRLYDGHHFFIHAQREALVTDVGRVLVQHLRPRTLYS